MKKIIVTFMLMAGMTAFAQTGHLTFKGVPIDGTLTEFVGKLKQKGLTHLGTREQRSYTPPRIHKEWSAKICVPVPSLIIYICQIYNFFSA